MRISQIQQRVLQLRGHSMIREAYLEWMNRSPSVRERRYWRRNLSRKHQTQLLQRLIRSSTVRKFVTREQPASSVLPPTRTIQMLYHLFRRPTDEFVIGLYEEFLHRTPQPGELQGYLNLLRSSDDYWTVFEMIALSPEAETIWEQKDTACTVSDLLQFAFAQDGRAFVQRLTRELFARSPTRAEMKRFRRHSVSHEDKEKVLKTLLYSNAFRRAIRQHRLPDGRAVNGFAISRLRRLYRQSGIHFVTTLYRELLGREPDAQGTALHLKLLRRTRKLELIRGVLLSQESAFSRVAAADTLSQRWSTIPDVKLGEFQPINDTNGTEPSTKSVGAVTYETAVNWHSLVQFLPGYGNASRNLMTALDDEKVQVSYRYVFGPGTHLPFEEVEPDLDERINIFRTRNWNSDIPEVVFGIGDMLYRNTSKYKIGYTMLESTRIPSEWVRQANLMNEVWVPTGFNVETFQDSGVRTPIYVMPLGVDPKHYNPNIIGPRFSEKFTFLSVFEWSIRKSPEELIRTFCDEFAHEDDVVLVLKVMNRDPQFDISSAIRRLGLGRNIEKIHVIYNQDIPHYFMGQLYHAADCFVLPTRGEGWGMPILEAMACGLPTIATDWSAQREFLNSSTGYPIQVKRLVPAPEDIYYHSSLWAEPDWSHMAYLMRYVYENREIAKQRSSEAAQLVLNQWNWKEAAKKIKTRLMAVQSSL